MRLLKILLERVFCGVYLSLRVISSSSIAKMTERLKLMQLFTIVIFYLESLLVDLFQVTLVELGLCLVVFCWNNA